MLRPPLNSEVKSHKLLAPVIFILIRCVKCVHLDRCTYIMWLENANGVPRYLSANVSIYSWQIHIFVLHFFFRAVRGSYFKGVVRVRVIPTAIDLPNPIFLHHFTKLEFLVLFFFVCLFARGRILASIFRIVCEQNNEEKSLHGECCLFGFLLSIACWFPYFAFFKNVGWFLVMFQISNVPVFLDFILVSIYPFHIPRNGLVVANPEFSNYRFGINIRMCLRYSCYSLPLSPFLFAWVNQMEAYYNGCVGQTKGEAKKRHQQPA